MHNRGFRKGLTRRLILTAIASILLIAGCGACGSAAGETETDPAHAPPDIELVKRLAKDYEELTFTRDATTFTISTADTGDFVSLWELKKWEPFTPEDSAGFEDYFNISGSAEDGAVEVLFGAVDGDYLVCVNNHGLSAFFKIPVSAALTIAQQFDGLYSREMRGDISRPLTLLEEYALELYADGWQWIPAAQAQELYPVTFDLPEGSEYGGVFVKANPGIPEEGMIVQFWCAPDRSWLLKVTQYRWTEPAPDKVGDVLFSGSTEVGLVRDAYPWAENLCTQEIFKDGVYVQMYMLVDETLDVWDCGDIMRTLQFQG